MKNHGFSLVELSIVLVILGLLTGGVLTGQSLIRASELRSVTTEYQNYQTAVNTFKSKYFAIPGDMGNAHSFWGSAGGSGVLGDGCEAATGTGTETCSGDGNNRLDVVAADEYSENFTFWQHLANAGLINGTFTGVAGSGDNDDSVGNVNVPVSKLSGGLWYAVHWASPTITGNSQFFNGTYGNWMSMGALNAGDDPENGIMAPEELWNIDTKIDDGQPARGKVVVRERVDCTLQSDGSAQAVAGANAALLDSVYNLASQDKDCAVAFREAF